MAPGHPMSAVLVVVQECILEVLLLYEASDPRDGSGFDEILSESVVYGPTTVRQILVGNHVNRAVNAHSILVSALLALKCSPFSQSLSVEK